MVVVFAAVAAAVDNIFYYCGEYSFSHIFTKMNKNWFVIVNFIAWYVIRAQHN